MNYTDAHRRPEDYVLATGQTTTVRAFCEMAFSHLAIELRWEGKGINEKGIVAGIDEKIMAKHLNSSQLSPGETLIEVDSQYFRPTEVDVLLGDATKAKEQLGWSVAYNIEALVKDMVESDFKKLMNGPEPVDKTNL